MSRAKTISDHEFPRSTRDDAYNPLWNHSSGADGSGLSLGMLQTESLLEGFRVALQISRT